MAERRTLAVKWYAINGAANGKRKLILRLNDNNKFTCPVTLCLHADFKSARGLRKHIDNCHPWYYYFEKQPEVKREEMEVIERPRKKAYTKNMPSYSMEEGLGKDFLDWLCTSCGGGKTFREGKQVANRALKFLMESTGTNDDDIPLSKDFIDCCLSSPSVIIKFLTTLENEWKISSSGCLNYVRAMT